MSPRHLRPSGSAFTTPVMRDVNHAIAICLFSFAPCFIAARVRCAVSSAAIRHAFDASMIGALHVVYHALLLMQAMREGRRRAQQQQCAGFAQAPDATEVYHPPTSVLRQCYFARAA